MVCTFHNRNGRLLACTYPNGVLNRYAYDALNRVLATQTIDATGVEIYAIGTWNGATGALTAAGYVYDSVGNRREIHERSRWADGSYIARDPHYEYDERYQLLSETGGGDPATYTYDSAGNRLTMTRDDVLTEYAYNETDGNQLSSWRSAGGAMARYAYDANGNRIRKEKLAGGAWEITEYGYDTSNRLIEAKSASVSASGVASPAFAVRVNFGPPGATYGEYLVDSGENSTTHGDFEYGWQLAVPEVPCESVDRESSASPVARARSASSVRPAAS